MNPIDFQKRIEKINEIDYKIDFLNEKIENHKIDYIDCNTFDIDENVPIYKIIRLDDLKRIFNLSALSLSKPEKWKDPNETFLFNYVAKNQNGNLISFNYLKSKIYCSCWSLKEESEGLWNTHARNNEIDYVKIRSTPKKIMNYLYDINNEFHYLSYFCGKVLYVKKEEIEAILCKNIGGYFTSMNWLSTIFSLLIKREEFDYEEEVRFIFNAPEDSSEKIKCQNGWNILNDYFYFKIDINDVIEEIVFQPSIEKEKLKKLQEEIKKYYAGKIYKSKLYEKENKILNF